MRSIAKLSCLMVAVIYTSIGIAYPKHILCPARGADKAGQGYRLQTEKNATPVIYLFKNQAEYPIILNHHKKNPGAGAGWASILNPNKWSALFITENNFTLRCDRLEDKHYKAAECKLLVCSWDGIMPNNKMGNYWVAEDQTLTATVQKIRERTNP